MLYDMKTASVKVFRSFGDAVFMRSPLFLIRRAPRDWTRRGRAIQFRSRYLAQRFIPTTQDRRHDHPTAPHLRAALRRTALAAAVCLLCAAPLRAADYLTVAGRDADAFQKWIDEVRNNDMRPIYVNGYNAGDSAEFAGVAVPNAGSLKWDAKINLSSDDYKDMLDSMKKRDFRPLTVSGYMNNGKRRYAAVFVKDEKPIKWEARHNQTRKEYDETLKNMRKNGMRPAIVTGCVDTDGDVHFTSLFVDAGDRDWQSKHDLTAAKYTDQVGEWLNNGFRPVDVSVYDTDDGPRFTAVAVKDDHSWVAVAGMTRDKYQDKLKEKEGQGFRPVAICGYRDGGKLNYAALFYRKD